MRLSFWCPVGRGGRNKFHVTFAVSPDFSWKYFGSILADAKRQNSKWRTCASIHNSQTGGSLGFVKYCFSYCCVSVAALTPGVASYIYSGRSRLVIERARKYDEGTYMCVAVNPAGIRRAVAAVRVKGYTTTATTDNNNLIIIIIITRSLFEVVAYRQERLWRKVHLQQKPNVPIFVQCRRWRLFPSRSIPTATTYYTTAIFTRQDQLILPAEIPHSPQDTY